MSLLAYIAVVANSAQDDEPDEPYNPVTALGPALIVYLDAEQINGSDGDPISTVPNTGTENDFSKQAGTITLAVESGKKAINIGSGGNLLAGSTTPALSEWTFYAILKTSNAGTYVLKTNGFNGTKALIYRPAGNYEWFQTGTNVGSASTSVYTIAKVTVGDTANGNWSLGNADWQGSFRAVIGCNRHLTSSEETALENWLNTRL